MATLQFNSIGDWYLTYFLTLKLYWSIDENKRLRSSRMCEIKNISQKEGQFCFVVDLHSYNIFYFRGLLFGGALGTLDYYHFRGYWIDFFGAKTSIVKVGQMTISDYEEKLKKFSCFSRYRSHWYLIGSVILCSLWQNQNYIKILKIKRSGPNFLIWA